MGSIQPIILSNNITNHPQISGYGANLEELSVSVKVDALISPQETRSFILALNLQVGSQTYQHADTFTKDNINNEGYILIGSIYVIGPVNEDDITSTAELTFVTLTT